MSNIETVVPNKQSLSVQVSRILSDFSIEEKEMLLPLLIQKHLMVLMVPDRLRSQVSDDLTDESRVMTDLFQLWADKYGDIFRQYFENPPQQTVEEVESVERLLKGVPTSDDCTSLVKYLESRLGVFFDNEEEVDKFVQSVTH